MDKNNDNVISHGNQEMVKYVSEQVIDMQKESELYNTVYKEISELSLCYLSFQHKVCFRK